MHYDSVWSFKTARFTVALQIAQDYGYQAAYDEMTQRKLDAGDYVAFDSRVVVYYDGHEISSDSLGGSVYESNKVHEFWTLHYESDAAGRNTLAQKARNVAIAHYFPYMVRQAIAEARSVLCNVPKLRCA